MMKKLLRRLTAALAVLPLLAAQAVGQGAPTGVGPFYAPNWYKGYVPTAQEWTMLWSNKVGYYAGGIPIQYGGTGATTASAARISLGIPSISTTVNGQTCTLGSSCTVTAAATNITVGSTVITGGTSGRVLYQNGSVLDEMTTSGSGTQLALTAGPTFSGTLTAATANFSGTVTSTNNGNPGFSLNAAAGTNRFIRWYTSGLARWDWGADYTAESGSNAGSNLFLNSFDDAGSFLGTPLSVARSTGAVTMLYGLTLGAALTYGGVTLANSVTGTGSMVLASGATVSSLQTSVDSNSYALIAGRYSSGFGRVAMNTRGNYGWEFQVNGGSGARIDTGLITFGTTGYDGMLYHNGTNMFVRPNNGGSSLYLGSGGVDHWSLNSTGVVGLSTSGFAGIAHDVAGNANGPLYHRIANANTGGATEANFDSDLTGVANGYALWGVVNNGGSPYARIAVGGGITGGLQINTNTSVGGDVKATASVIAAYGTSLPTGGTAGLGLKMFTTSNFGVFGGSGAPTLSAAFGSIYLRSDGAPYYNSSGSTAWTQLASSVDGVPVGSCTAYGGATAPTGWVKAFGQAISRTTFAAAFAVFGTVYGAGDGSTTFNIPDVRGRAVFADDSNGGSAANRLGNNSSIGGISGTASAGTAGGAQTHVQTVAELAAHYHEYTAIVAVPNGGAFDMVGAFNNATANTTSSGSSAAMNITPPALVMNYICKVQ